MAERSDDLDMTDRERELVDWVGLMLQQVQMIAHEPDLEKRRIFLEQVFEEIGEDEDKFDQFGIFMAELYQAMHGFSEDQIQQMMRFIEGKAPKEQHDA